MTCHVLEHVTVGEVTPTVYVKDKNDVIDESIQKSEVRLNFKYNLNAR